MPVEAPLPAETTQDASHATTATPRHPTPISTALLAADRKLRTTNAPIAPDQYLKLLLGALAKAVDEEIGALRDELQRASARQQPEE